MNYYIGIDGGGTKSHLVLTDENLNVIAENRGGPTNFLIIGKETVAKTIVDLINNTVKQAGINYDDIKGIFIGTTGAGRKNNADDLKNAIEQYAKSQGFTYYKLGVDSDARTALEGAFAGGPGSILIAGTGSIMFGKDANGNIHRIGGFGRWIGDEGSGFSIGRKGFIAVAKEFDGRGSETMLTKLLKSKYGIENSDILINKIYAENFDIASISQDVIECANRDDHVCQQILKEEATELFWHVVSSLKKLQLKELTISLIGSLLTNDNYYSKCFRDMTYKNLPQVTIADPIYNPAIGAVLMAKNL
ncbi:MAG TPA: BadF/BadG/BcrA/BcrD ATPase family protein [Ignavibacteriales bacterium]|nr:BadF/BadG/BcrA/BcrD ATPase family protein [Ignavibacteriales bacterium]